MHAQSDQERLEIELRLAEDYFWRAGESHYRPSAEARRGLTLDEYQQMMREKMNEALERAKKLVKTPANGVRFEAAVDICQRRKKGLVAKSEGTCSANRGSGSIAGVIRFEDGTPVADARVTLGLHVDVSEPDLANCVVNEMTYLPKIGPQESMQSRTDSQGRFAFDGVEAGVHEFIAVSLDPAKFAIATRFLAHQIGVNSRQTTRLELIAREWVSAAPVPIRISLPEEVNHRGARYRKISEQLIRNPFHYEFPKQLIHLTVPSS
jgi:hypothetical protein